MEKELQSVVSKIEELETTLKKESDFFKKSFISEEIKKLVDQRDTIKGKIERLKSLTGDVEISPPKTQEDDKSTQDVKEKKLEEGESADLISGPYHENVKVAGGKGSGEVHYYATEVAGEDKIKLDYLSPNGKSTGLLAKVVLKEEFSSKFISCVEHGCDIVKK